MECRSALVRMFGTAAGVAYRPDRAEVARRRACPIDPLTELDVLDALMGLPVGLAVPLSELTDAERLLVGRAPASAVERHGGQIVRLAAAPVSVQLAVVAAKDWHVGLDRASRLAPFCTRAMLLPAQPEDLSDVQVQASFYGVGVYVLSQRQLRTLVEPRPYVRMRHTPAHWWFAEEVYRQISEYENVSGGEPVRSARTSREGRPRH
jgi:hypothetical protein